MAAILQRFAQRASTRLAAARTLATNTVLTKTGAAFVAGAIAASPCLTGEDFFEHKFITKKDPDHVVDFYSTEDFLQILGIFPMAIHFVLAGVEWDLEKENTMSVHNAMEISFTIEEKEEELADGQKVVAFFQKRERFKNFIPFTRFILWDQIQCYGYKRMEDGTIEVFHRGEQFYGPLPIRLLVQLHARYVIWATEKHINSPAFGVASLEEQEHQRGNIPLHVLNDFIHRLSVAQQVALESGRIAVGASSGVEAEQSLKKLRKLRQTKTQAYVEQVRKSNETQSGLKLRRRLSVYVEDEGTQRAIDQALSDCSKTKEGQAAVADAMNALMTHPEVTYEKPRYGGAFRPRTIKKTLTSVVNEITGAAQPA